VKTVRTYPKYAVIDVPGLILIYLLLCILSILFCKTFFSEILQGGAVPDIFILVIFFTIPGVLLLFLAVSILSLLRDLITRQAGSRFHVRLLAYFGLIVLFAAIPVFVITGQSITELARLWRTIDVDDAINFAEEFAVSTYFSQLERFEVLAEKNDFNELMRSSAQRPAEGEPPLFPEGITAIQDFVLQEDGSWEMQGFLGGEDHKLNVPPSLQQGFALREMPRDRDRVRYVMYPDRKILRVISFNLGTGFDGAVETIKNEKLRFEIINSLMTKVNPLLILYYGIFFFPTLLMTLIIAISFTRQITGPIVELTEATRQVAAGDFSIHIQTRPKDELGTLIRSFNTMVQGLAKSQASLIKAEKLSIWQTMAEQLAHEIKNPLTPIKLSAERVLRRWRNEPERIGEIIEQAMLAIIHETEGLSTMLTEFRTLSRPLEPSLSSTKVWELAEEIISPYRSSHPKVRFNTSHLRPDISVKMDPQRFSQVLTNLIINGIDAMNGNGTIEIRADLVKKRESRYCRLSVKDTGKGISNQEKTQIFTPYFTTKKSGTGLGLSIVEQIVNDHGGSVWFNSAEGVGTTFFIDLPIDEMGVGVPEAAEDESVALEGRKAEL
jgi:nitrogen fixation/metabolism regulation signal transduction histidine kinase